MRVFAIVQGHEYEVDQTNFIVSKGKDGLFYYKMKESRVPQLLSYLEDSVAQVPLLNGGIVTSKLIGFRLEG